MIESSVLDEVKALIHTRAVRENILAVLETRFGTIPGERVVALQAIKDEVRLKDLLRLATICPDPDAFVAGLASGR